MEPCCQCMTAGVSTYAPSSHQPSPMPSNTTGQTTITAIAPLQGRVTAKKLGSAQQLGTTAVAAITIIPAVGIARKDILASRPTLGMGEWVEKACCSYSWRLQVVVALARQVVVSLYTLTLQLVLTRWCTHCTGLRCPHTAPPMGLPLLGVVGDIRFKNLPMLISLTGSSISQAITLSPLKECRT